MKIKIAAILFGVLLGSVVLLFGAEGLTSAQENEHPERTIEGTWFTTVTPVNCDTGAPVAPAFPGILSFNKGGTMSGTSTVAASAFGIWARSGGWGSYTFAFTNFRYNSSGVFIGSQIVRQSATLGATGDQFTSSGSVEILDPNGNVVGRGCANSTGRRFE
jgi:hypothetical protein